MEPEAQAASLAQAAAPQEPPAPPEQTASSAPPEHPASPPTPTKAKRNLQPSGRLPGPDLAPPTPTVREHRLAVSSPRTAGRSLCLPPGSLRAPSGLSIKSILVDMTLVSSSCLEVGYPQSAVKRGAVGGCKLAAGWRREFQRCAAGPSATLR